MQLNISELDIVMLTFDEPNKEHRWAALQQLAPWAKRVDGVVGFDSAHKAAANCSDTEYVITIDGDNELHPAFLDLQLTVQDSLVNSVLSFNSYNPLNGLTYGNGGVKIWPKQYILDMRTHENSPDSTGAASLDFCWTNTYVQLNNVYSTTHINTTPLQAFRAGFREGCKMTLDCGNVVERIETVADKMYPANLTRMMIWGSVGQDVKNGAAAILGTRLGVWYTNICGGDLTVVRDYSKFAEFAKEFLPTSPSDIHERSHYYMQEVHKHTGIQFTDLSAPQSAFFKRCLPKHPTYSNPMVTESSVESHNV